MSSRNVLFMVAMPFKSGLADYVEYSLKTWHAWCQRHGVRLFVWREPLEDVHAMKPTWQRYHLFDVLEREGIEFDRVAYLDVDTMVRWDCPNFFEAAGDGLGVVRDISPRWAYHGIKAYQRFFPGVDMPWYDYFNAGFTLLNRGHRRFFQAILEFYRANRAALLELEKEDGLGTDQTPVNFLARREGVPLKYLPPIFNLIVQGNLMERDLFVEMGHIWHFAGLPQEVRLDLMRTTWQTYSAQYGPL
jgi:lipopolysaccharide biosynthesis glycosyltransferase